MSIPVTRYHYRAHNIASPWTQSPTENTRTIRWRCHVESRMRANGHVRFGGAGRGNGAILEDAPRPGPTLPGGGQVGVPKLTLNHDQRNAFGFVFHRRIIDGHLFAARHM